MSKQSNPNTLPIMIILVGALVLIYQKIFDKHHLVHEPITMSSNSPMPSTQHERKPAINDADIEKLDKPVFVDKEPLAPSNPDYYIPQAMPANGYTKYYTNAELVAPLYIAAPPQKNVLVKIIDPHFLQPVLTVFVRANETIEIKMPLGEYALKYAMGENWYGDDRLFGDSTTYKRADKILDFTKNATGFSGHQIILQQQIDGNLHSEDIEAKDF